jgi:hypothetical protein
MLSVPSRIALEPSFSFFGVGRWASASLLETARSISKMAAVRHNGFWQAQRMVFVMGIVPIFMRVPALNGLLPGMLPKLQPIHPKSRRKTGQRMTISI